MDESVFRLTVIECQNLCSVHHSNLPDPYVKITLEPDKKSKKKSRAIKDVLNPVFNDM